MSLLPNHLFDATSGSGSYSSFYGLIPEQDLSQATAAAEEDTDAILEALQHYDRRKSLACA